MKRQNLGLWAIFLAGCNLSASIITYDANLSGPNESPSNATTATASAVVTINDSLNTMGVDITFAGLSAAATSAHIQCCTAAAFTGTAGLAALFPTFPASTSGTFTLTYDLTSLATYSTAFVTASGGTAADAEATLLAGLAGGLAYVNIHDSI